MLAGEEAGEHVEDVMGRSAGVGGRGGSFWRVVPGRGDALRGQRLERDPLSRTGPGGRVGGAWAARWRPPVGDLLPEKPSAGNVVRRQRKR